MKFEFNIEKKHFWTLAVLGVLLLGLVGAGIVIATTGGGNDPDKVGHYTTWTCDTYDDEGEKIDGVAEDIQGLTYTPILHKMRAYCDSGEVISEIIIEEDENDDEIIRMEWKCCKLSVR